MCFVIIRIGLFIEPCICFLAFISCTPGLLHTPSSQQQKRLNTLSHCTTMSLPLMYVFFFFFSSAPPLPTLLLYSCCSYTPSHTNVWAPFPAPMFCSCLLITLLFGSNVCLFNSVRFL